MLSKILMAMASLFFCAPVAVREYLLLHNRHWLPNDAKADGTFGIDSPRQVRQR